jgi:hypothetical protein
MHIVDDEQRSDRRATPMRPLGSSLEGASASLALLDDVHRHRLRRVALHLPLPSQERGPFQFSDRLLAQFNSEKLQLCAGFSKFLYPCCSLNCKISHMIPESI